VEKNAIHVEDREFHRPSPNRAGTATRAGAHERLSIPGSQECRTNILPTGRHGIDAGHDSRSVARDMPPDITPALFVPVNS